MDCVWLGRVSALLDDELLPVEAELVRAHLSSCSTCQVVMYVDGDIASHTTATESNNSTTTVFLATRPKVARLFLGLSGLAMVVFAVFSFVRGSRGGDGLHDLRHLGIWQASLGVSLVAVSLSFRLSLFLISTSVSFLILTMAAAVVDVAMGHSGPWADPTHLVEILAIATLLVLARPQIRLLRRSRGQLTVLRADSRRGSRTGDG